MKDYLFHSEELLDQNALELLEGEHIPGLLPCRWVHWNSMIQLVYFTRDLTPLSQVIDDLSLDEVKSIGRDIVDYIKTIDNRMELSPENVVWDTDSIYLNEDRQVYIICLPAVIPIESLQSKIYVKRLYSMLSDIFSHCTGGDFVRRQIEAQQNKDAQNWDELKEAIGRDEPIDVETIKLKSINTPQPVEFVIGHSKFVLGSDEHLADGYLDLNGISGRHALIGWNDVNFFVQDLGSDSGTYLNDVEIEPQVEIPLGSGSILKLGDYTFNVE